MHFLIVVSLFISLIYPILLSLFGLEWVSSDDSPLYKICVIGINAVVIIYIFIYELLHFRKARGSLLPYFIPIIIIILHWAEILLFEAQPNISTSSQTFQYFFAFSVTGIFSGTYCYRYRKLPVIIKNFELVMLICAVALIAAIPGIAESTMVRVSIGGGNHQAISYSTALSFGALFCSLYKYPNFKRYKIFNYSIYRQIATLILIILPLVCLLGGGRGGAVLLIINFIACTYFVAKKSIFKLFLKIAIVVVIIYNILPFIPMAGLEDHLQNGIDRSFAYITDGGIDMREGSSGRDEVYSISLDLISQRPLTGYGMFYQYDLCMRYMQQPYSHNIFLEVILQFGLLGLIAYIVIFVFFAKNISSLIRKGSYYYYLIPLASLPTILLLFSGTYLLNAPFWFINIVAFCYPKNLSIEK